MFSVIMSKIKTWIRITSCDHIQSFNRGWVVLLRNKSKSDKKFQITSLYGTKMWCQIKMVMWQLIPTYFKNLRSWCEINERIMWGNYSCWGMAKDLAPGYPNNHIWREKVTHNYSWREWGHIEPKSSNFHLICYKFRYFPQITKNIFCWCAILSFHDFWVKNVEMAMVKKLVRFLHHSRYNGEKINFCDRQP